MPAYLVVDTEVLDETALIEYQERFRPMLAEAGGKVLFSGDVVESLDSELTNRRRVSVWEFESVGQAKEWFLLPQRSPEYAELAHLRDQAAKISRFIIDGDK